MKERNMEKMKEDFRDLYWSFHQKTCKLSDVEVKKRLKRIANALEKVGIKIIV